MREVDVLYKNVYAGTLTERTKNEYVFRYGDDYLNNPSLPPVSLTLPKTQQEYVSQYVFPFFTNLLPEGTNRKVFCSIYKLDEKDFFGMLMATDGLDIIGNVSIKNKLK